MSELQTLQARKERLEQAKMDILVGDRVSSADSDGMGNASFQNVSVDTINKEIAKIEKRIQQIQGLSTRFCGTPRVG